MQLMVLRFVCWDEAFGLLFGIGYGGEVKELQETAHKVAHIGRHGCVQGTHPPAIHSVSGTHCYFAFGQASF
jgi:hypothetical protein